MLLFANSKKDFYIAVKPLSVITMELTLTLTNTPESIIEKNRVIWRLYSRTRMLIFALQFLLGAFFLIDGANSEYTFRSDINNNITTYNLHLGISFGLAFVLLSLIYYYHLSVAKRKFFQKIYKYTKLFQAGSGSTSMVFNETCIKYADSEMTFEIKWSAVSHYQVYKDYIFLLTDDTMSSTLSIDKKQLTEQELSQLLAFIQEKQIPLK